MSANIFGERYVGRKIAWHELGTVFGEKDISMVEAVRMAGIDYEVHLCPLKAQFTTSGKKLIGVQVSKPETLQIPIDNRMAIVREPTPDDPDYRTFGIVSKKYEIIQNIEIAEIMDQLSDEWKVETAGALGEGENSFFSLKIDGIIDIKGDPIEQYFLVSDKKTGKDALKVAFTPVRVVCKNTLTVGLGQANVLSFMSHTDGIENRLDNRIKALKQMQSMREQILANFNLMAEKTLKDVEIQEIIAEAYPEPSKPQRVKVLEQHEDEDLDLLESFFNKATISQERYLYYQDQALKRREQAREELVRINDEELTDTPNLKNTAWAVWQAVTSREDHRKGPKSLYESTLFGKRAQNKIRAYEKALVLAQE